MNLIYLNCLGFTDTGVTQLSMLGMQKVKEKGNKKSGVKKRRFARIKKICFSWKNRKTNPGIETQSTSKYLTRCFEKNILFEERHTHYTRDLWDDVIISKTLTFTQGFDLSTLLDDKSMSPTILQLIAALKETTL